MATVTSSKRHLDITSTSLSTSSNVDVGAKLTIGTTDANTSSTTALVLNNTEVEKRTLGSMAFEATSSYLSSSGVVFVLAGNNIEAGDGISLAGGLSYNATTNTLSQTDNNTTYTAGTGLTLSGTEFSVTASTYAAATHSHSDATTSASGFMSSDDKTKLDGISTGADVTPSWVPSSDPSYLTAHPSITQASNVNNSGGTVIQDLTFDSNGHVTATGSVNLDNIYTSTDGTEDDFRFSLNLGNFTGTRWYKVGTVNTGSGGMRIRGMLTNHVESFGSCMIDLAIQGREGNANNDIEITGHVHSLNENSGVAVYQSETASGNYQNWDVYVVATKYTQCELDLTKVSCSFDTSGNNVTNEPEGTKELDTSTLSEGNYVIRDSTAYRVFDAGINLSGGLSYTASTNTLSQTDNNTTYSVATTSANGLMSSTDKSKLDGISANANNYSLPVAGSSIGGVKSGTDITVDASGNVSVNNDSHTHDGRYYTETEINTGNITTSGTWTFNGVVNGLYHSVEEDHYYFDDYNGRRNINAFLKTQRSDIIKYRDIGAIEYWNGSSWVDATSTLIGSVEKLLDGRQDTSWSVPETYYKFRFTVTASTSWPTMSLIGMQMSWTGSSYPGCQMLVEELQTDNSWSTKVTADFTSGNGVTTWGTMTKADTALHTGRGSQTYATRITVDFYGWSPSNSSYVTIPLQNIFIYSNFSGLENNDYQNLFDYNRHATLPNKLYITTTETNTSSTTALVLNDTEVEQRTLGSAAFSATTDFATASQGTTADDALPKAGGTMTGNILLGTNSIAADTTSPTAHIQVGAGTTNTGNRSDVALLGASNSGGVVNALGLVNTAAGANNNGVALNFHNGNAWSPTGQIIVQQNSSGTSTDSAMKFYTYDGGLNHRMSIKNDGTIRFNAYGSGLIASDANGNLSVDTNTYLTAIADNSVGITQLNVTDGTSGQVLTTDGNGTLSFSTVSAGTSYTLPTASSSALGGVKIGYTANAKNYPVVLDTNDKAYVNVPWTDTNTNTTYSAGSGLSLSSTTFSVDEFIEDKHIYTKNENGTTNKGIFMPMVKGGFYATSTSTITGRLKILLPSYQTNMMLSFKLDIYEYNTDRTVSYQISGYNNNDDNATWYNTSVVCLSDSDNRNLTVRFLRDLEAQEQYICIGETTTTWAYPQVIVRDFMGGYNTQIQKASGSWSISFIEDDPGFVVSTHSNNTPIVLTSRLSGTISTSQLADNSVNATKLDVSGSGTSGEVLTSDGDGSFSWTAKTTNTDTVTSVGISGSETTGTVTIAASGAASVSQSGSTITIDATNTNTVTSVGVSGSEASGTITIAGSGATSVSQSGNTITISSTDTNTNTTYSAGNGLDLTGTSFSVEADLRDGITHVGKDTSNYITFDSTNGRIDFYAGGVFVARMESDGDLHIKGDVIAFSDIFS